MSSQKKLKNKEKETVVHFDQSNLMATVSTYNLKWINRLNKYGLVPVLTDENGLHIYKDVEAHWMCPRRPAQRSAEQKEASKRNMQKLHDGEPTDMEEEDDDEE